MKWRSDWKKILKTYSFLSIIANLFVAVSIAGLSVLGVLSSSIAFGTLVTVAIALGLIGAVGRFVDQSYDDIKEDEDVQ